MSGPGSSELIGRGWHYPLRCGQNGAVSLVDGVEEIEQAIYLILATAPGERPMRPEFGCPLIDYVFAPLDATTMGEIAFEVRRALERWEPRVTVHDVTVRPDADRGAAVLIDITYQIRDTYDRRSLVFPFYVIPPHD
jgi:phage baseplate assembly protein W